MSDEPTWASFSFPPPFRYAEPLNLCIDNNNELAVCANNCLGVDPNAVVIAGTALTTASAFGFLGPISLQALGVGLFGAFTLGGGAYVMSGACAPLFCRVRTHSSYFVIMKMENYKVGNTCRLPAFTPRGIRCPRN